MDDYGGFRGHMTPRGVRGRVDKTPPPQDLPEFKGAQTKAINDAELVAKEIASKTDTSLYTFSIGSPFKVKQRDMPRLYIDISDTFNKKKEALKEFHSQEHWLIYYKLIAQLSNKIAGMHSHNKYAEVFYKW